MKIRSRKLGHQGSHNNGRNCRHKQGWGNSLGQISLVWLIQHLSPVQPINGSEQWFLWMCDCASWSKAAFGHSALFWEGFPGSCAPVPPISFSMFSCCSFWGSGELVAMWLIGFDISDRRVTRPHPHLPVTQPPGGSSWRHWCSGVDEHPARSLFICTHLSGDFFPPRISEYHQASVPP